MGSEHEKFRFAIDRGGTFTDVYAECPGGVIKALKLLSEDPENYSDAPREGNTRSPRIFFSSPRGTALRSKMSNKIDQPHKRALP